MGHTFVEKMFARKVGRPVAVNEICVIEPDFAMSHDNAAAIIGDFKKIGVPKVRHPERIVLVLDHVVPAASEKEAENHRKIRAFVAEQGLPNFHDVGRGICHQVLCEEGFARPGRFLVGSDSHTCTYGAFGAFATGIVRSEIAAIWATGELWFKVPESIRITLTGTLPPLVEAKDLILRIIGDIGSDGAFYKSVEFLSPEGEGFSAMTVADRMTICNMTIEMGGKNGYFRPDAKTWAWLEAQSGGKIDRAGAIEPDADAAYAQSLSYKAEALVPMVACPPDVDNVATAEAKKDVRIDQALIGTCTNGRIEDLRVAASFLKGRKVAKGVRLLVFPASSRVYRQALDEGLLGIFMDAGAILMNTGCGPCLGAHEGALAPGEVCISTANRNFRGRMGCNDADVYLGSVATVAASAVTGRITDPRSL